MNRWKMAAVAIAACGALVSGCKSNTCDLNKADACDKGEVCEAVEGAEPACFPETALSGRVFDATTNTGIAGARVVAIDATTNAAASDVVLTGEDGSYRIPFQFSRTSDPAAGVTTRSFTLRVASEGYQNFPTAIRVAVPVQVTRADDPKALPENTRDVSLLPIEGADPATLGSISGKVSDGSAAVGGVLVVAEGGAEASSAVTDSSGNYAILNLPAGTYAVHGYVAGKDFEPATGVALASGEEKTPVDLAVKATPQLTTITGGVNLVDASGRTAEPVVVLALASTHEVPAGLQSGTPGQRFNLAGIPPGTYDILASYNNDGLVVDPDPQQLPRPIRITLPDDAPGGTLDVGAFKITGAVDLNSPGKELNEAPIPAAGLTFDWVDDAGEDFYSVEVFDAFGTRIWGADPISTSTGGTEPTFVARNVHTLVYAGPALDPGATYQWRVTSYTNTPVQKPISRSENLRGIFTIAR